MAKVCIVDDCTFITELYSHFLTDKGHSVTCFNTPFGATAKIASAQPDVVLMDLHLPGLSGDGLLPLLKGSSSFQIILISTDSEESSMQKMVASGLASDYFVKSEKLEMLHLKIKNAVAPPA